MGLQSIFVTIFVSIFCNYISIIILLSGLNIFGKCVSWNAVLYWLGMHLHLPYSDKGRQSSPAPPTKMSSFLWLKSSLFCHREPSFSLNRARQGHGTCVCVCWYIYCISYLLVSFTFTIWQSQLGDWGEEQEWTLKLLTLLRIWPQSRQGKNWLCNFMCTFSRLSLAFFFPHWSHEYSSPAPSSGCWATLWSFRLLRAL